MIYILQVFRCYWILWGYWW